LLSPDEIARFYTTTPHAKNRELEDVLCSRLTIRILKLLEQLGRLNFSDIAQRIGTNYKATSTRLKSLESEGVLRHIELGRIRLYSFKDSPKARAVVSFLEVLEA